MNAIIFGSTSDIGTEICRKLAKNGHNRLIVHGRNKNSLSNLCKEMELINVECFPLLMDLDKTVDKSILLEQIKSTSIEKINTYVYCPGMCGEMTPVSFLNLSKDVNVVMQLNFLSALETLETVEPFLAPQSSVIFISSTNSFIPMECGTSYCCSKAALTELSKAKAVQLGSKGIRVNAIAPGYVPTKFHEPYFNSEDELNEFFSECKDSTILGRLASCEGVANVACFLAGRESRDITGTQVVVDCGESIKYNTE